MYADDHQFYDMSSKYLLLTEMTRLVRDLLYLYCDLDGFGNDFYSDGLGKASNF